jgi:hypothetical protein
MSDFINAVKLIEEGEGTAMEGMNDIRRKTFGIGRCF